MTGDDCEYQADPQVEAVLDQHFSTKRFYATDVVAHFADPGMFDRIVYVLSNRMGQDGIPFYLHTTDVRAGRVSFPSLSRQSRRSKTTPNIAGLRQIVTPTWPMHWVNWPDNESALRSG